MATLTRTRLVDAVWAPYHPFGGTLGGGAGEETAEDRAAAALAAPLTSGAQHRIGAGGVHGTGHACSRVFGQVRVLVRGRDTAMGVVAGACELFLTDTFEHSPLGAVSSRVPGPGLDIPEWDPTRWQADFKRLAERW